MKPGSSVPCCSAEVSAEPILESSSSVKNRSQARSGKRLIPMQGLLSRSSQSVAARLSIFDR